MKVKITGNLNKALDKFAQSLKVSPSSDTLGGLSDKNSKPSSNVRDRMANRVKNTIKSGKFDPLSETTIFITQKGLSPNSGYSKTSSKKPLIHTGRLLESIKATKNGISMAEYGQYHLEPRATVENGFTKWFYNRYKGDKKYPRGVQLARQYVPARNFLKPQKRAQGVISEQNTKNYRDEIEKAVYNIINDIFGN